MSDAEVHMVPPLSEAQRLSEYAIGVFGAYPTRSSIKKAIKQGLVLVNEETGETGTWIRGGEQLSLSPYKRLGMKKTLRLPLDILFEDDHMAVIHKPPSIEVSGNQFRTIEHALPHNLRESPLPDALPVSVAAHRLDHPTSGVLLIAKTRSALRHLHEQFEERRIHKTYLAVVFGATDRKKIIHAPIDGKESETEFGHIMGLKSPRLGSLSLIYCYPHSGRRHQIRKHLAGIGHPILGDEQYAPEDFRIQGRGLYLHAKEIEFTHPATGERRKIYSSTPGKFRRLFDL